MKKNGGRLLLTFAIILAMWFTVGISSEAKGKITKVQITAPTKKSSYTMIRQNKNVTRQLAVKVFAKGGASKGVTYQSSNRKIVSVSPTGLLTAKRGGKARITVTAKGNKKKKDVIKVTVKQKAASLTARVRRPVYTYSNHITLVKGRKYSIGSSIKPSHTSNKKLSYKSSQNSVVKVTSKGKLIAKKEGVSLITITTRDGTKKKTAFTVYVTKKVEKKVRRLSLSVDKEVLLQGETLEIPAVFEPLDATFQKLYYKSSNPKVVTVNTETGKVTALAPGEAVIKARALDGSKKTASVKVKVGEAYTQIIPASEREAAITLTVRDDIEKKSALIEKMFLAVTRAGDRMVVAVSGSTDTAENREGKAVYIEDMTLAEYIRCQKINKEEMTVTYHANAAKAVEVLDMVKSTEGAFNYIVKTDEVTLCNLEISVNGIRIKADAKEYEAEVTRGVIFIKGDVTAESFLKNLAGKKYASVCVVGR